MLADATSGPDVGAGVGQVFTNGWFLCRGSLDAQPLHVELLREQGVNVELLALQAETERLSTLKSSALSTQSYAYPHWQGNWSLGLLNGNRDDYRMLCSANWFLSDPVPVQRLKQFPGLFGTSRGPGGERGKEEGGKI
eukprot:2104367-Rhodomonas_salina.2